MPPTKPEPVLHPAIAGNLAVLADIVGNAVEALGEAQAGLIFGRLRGCCFFYPVGLVG